MGTNMDREKIADMIAGELTAVSDAALYEQALGDKDGDNRTGTIGALVYTAVKKSNLK